MKEKADYEGFRTRPMSWETAVQKFEKLAAAHTGRSLCQEIVSAVSNIEAIQVSDLAKLLANVMS